MKEGKLQKIGVMGGSFDPVHIGHLIIAEHAVESLGLDQVLFVPCNLPPHKREGRLTPAQHRLRMVELGVEGNPRFRACECEILRGGVSYSIDTVNELIGNYGGQARIYFIIGADSLRELHTWKEYRKLLLLCTFVTAARPGFDLGRWSPGQDLFTDEEVAVLKRKILPTPLIGVSSTEIRKRRREGRSIRYMVPDPVKDYIISENLYAGDG